MLSAARDEFYAGGPELFLGTVLHDNFTDKCADDNIEVLAARIGQVVRLCTMVRNQSGMRLTVMRNQSHRGRVAPSMGKGVQRVRRKINSFGLVHNE